MPGAKRRLLSGGLAPWLVPLIVILPQGRILKRTVPIFAVAAGAGVGGMRVVLGVLGAGVEVFALGGAGSGRLSIVRSVRSRFCSL